MLDGVGRANGAHRGGGWGYEGSLRGGLWPKDQNSNSTRNSEKHSCRKEAKFYTAVVTSIAIRSKKDITCPHRKAGEGRAAVCVITAPDGAGKPTAPTYGSQPPFRENWDGTHS